MTTLKNTIRAIEADLIRRIESGAEIWFHFENGTSILANANAIDEIECAGVLRKYAREQALATQGVERTAA